MTTGLDLRSILLNKLGSGFVGWGEAASMGDRWRIEPYVGAMNTINVLVDRNRYTPSVWVFDPYYCDDSVLHSILESVADVDSLMVNVHGRVQRAATLHRAINEVQRKSMPPVISTAVTSPAATATTAAPAALTPPVATTTTAAPVLSSEPPIS